MMNNNVQIKDFVFTQYLNDEEIHFLLEFDNKQESVNKQIKSAEDKKEKVLIKISDSKKKLENDPRQLRDFINNSESVLESIERIYSNLSDLLNLYRDIEKLFLIVAEKSDLKLENYNFEQDINRLKEVIKKASSMEISINIDNEKNYLIVNSFLDKTLKYNFNNEKNVDFRTLNLDNLQDNLVLKIYEKRVELPYTKKEVEDFLETYPDNYKTVQDVIAKEFMIHISLFNKHPVLSRFKEAYYLCRTKEMMSVFDSFNYAKSIMFRSEISSYIIAACKSKRQLEDYIYCLENNKLDEYKHFKIIFNVNPLAVK